ncbi:MAG TPA: extracellular solute-binding protein, partial [Candidatus Angelobacter sp.]|nr:extracellular solute-binding protein [Candidatus Angelobacter sp.]
MLSNRFRAVMPIGLTLALILAACGNGDGGTDPTSSPDGTDPAATMDPAAACDGVESLSFTHTMNDQESPVIAEIAEAFEGTTVDVTQIPFDGAQQAYDQQAAGGEAPDVFRAEIAWIADYADKGYLVDLTDMVP